MCLTQAGLQCETILRYKRIVTYFSLSGKAVRNTKIPFTSKRLLCNITPRTLKAECFCNVGVLFVKARFGGFEIGKRGESISGKNFQRVEVLETREVTKMNVLYLLRPSMKQRDL